MISARVICSAGYMNLMSYFSGRLTATSGHHHMTCLNVKFLHETVGLEDFWKGQIHKHPVYEAHHMQAMVHASI